jgi:hypothetical protein
MQEPYSVNLIKKRRAGGRVSTDNGSFINIKSIPITYDVIRPAIG